MFNFLYNLKKMRENRRGGSAPIFEGKIYILSVFLDTRAKRWTVSQKRAILGKQYEAEDWLVDEARGYGKSVSFEGGHFGVDNSIRLDFFHKFMFSWFRDDWTRMALKKAGYDSPREFYDWVVQNTDCSKCLVVIYPNLDGRSFAHRFGKKDTDENYFVDGCVCYNKWSKHNFDVNSALIAHEILHLFGAWDLYPERGVLTEKRAREGEREFPNSIMRYTKTNINKLRIDRLSAWLVGLNEDYEKVFKRYIPAKEKYFFL